MLLHDTTITPTNQITIPLDHPVKCPKDGHEFPLREGLAAKAVEMLQSSRREAEAEALRMLEERVGQQAVQNARAELAGKVVELQEKVAGLKKAHRAEVEEIEYRARKASEKVRKDADKEQEQLRQHLAKLQTERDLLSQERTKVTEEQRRLTLLGQEMELAMAQKLAAERAKIAKTAAECASVEWRLKEQSLVEESRAMVRERDQLQQQLAKIDTQRKAEAAQVHRDQQRLLAAEREKTASEVRTELEVKLQEMSHRLSHGEKLMEELRKTALHHQQAALEWQAKVKEEAMERAAAVAEAEQQARQQARDKYEVQARVRYDEMLVREQQVMELKLRESEKQREQALALANELKRKMSQRSEKGQGDVLEEDFGQSLQAKFASDKITRVERGHQGADIHHVVVTPQGVQCGVIVWELKNTRTWSDRWVDKIQRDRAASGADWAVLLSSALPANAGLISQVGNVWVCSPLAGLALAVVLRRQLAEIHAARESAKGRRDTANLALNYLQGPRFRSWVEVAVCELARLQGETEQERRAMTRIWKSRETRIAAVLEGMAGLCGELEGIIGPAGLPMPGPLRLESPASGALATEQSEASS